jgi:DNA-directed RNA polymerase specialized sigma24 family protein
MTPKRAPFPSTHWSLLRRAAEGGEGGRHLEEFLRHYEPALRSFLLHNRGLSEADAADVLQAFLADKVLAGDFLARARPEGGRFRSFVRVALHNYLMSWYRRNRRWMQAEIRPNEELPVRVQPDATALSFDAEWARGVLEDALERLERRYRESGEEVRWAIFEARLLRPARQGKAPEPYARIRQRFDLPSPSEAYQMLNLAKEHLRQYLMEIVREYSPGEDQVQAELEELQRALAADGGAA